MAAASAEGVMDHVERGFVVPAWMRSRVAVWPSGRAAAWLTPAGGLFVLDGRPAAQQYRREPTDEFRPRDPNAGGADRPPD